MPLTLNLGEIDAPYSTPPAKDGKDAKPNSATTGDVAGWLEDRYHPMLHFYEMQQGVIAKEVADSLVGSLESAAMGAPSEGANPFGAAESAIEIAFKQFLTLRTLETLGYPGLPTQAALDGVNHRLKLKRGPRRPSLIDTGLYQASFKAWFSE